MTYERIRASALPQAFSDVVSDVADLFQKELRLAGAEVSAKIAAKLHAGIWLSTAGLLGLLALLACLEGVILLIASYGLALHSASFIVAAVLAAAAGLFVLRGRSDARETMVPTRAVHQIKKDISTAKEQLT